MTSRGRLTGSVLFRLAAGYVLVALILAAAWVWSLYAPLNSAVLRQQQANLTAVAQSAALVTSQPGVSATSIAEQLVARTDLRLTIVAADGGVLADSDRNPASMENHAGRPEVAAALDGRTGADQRVSATEGVEQLYVAVPGSLEGERVAIRVSQPTAEIDAIAARSRRIGLLLLAVALAIVAAVSTAATRTATRPTAELSAAAARMASGDLHTPLPPVPADLEGLATSIGLLRDQTRERLEALDAERRSLSMTLDGLPDAVLVFESGRVLLGNRPARALTGMSAQSSRGATLEELGLPGSVSSVLRGLLGSGEARTLELEPDPTGRTLRLSVTPLGEPDTPGRTIVTISDITERARLERVRRDFVANASHELKTPVSGMLLLSESAMHAASDGDAEQSLQFTSQIHGEAQRLQRLVMDLLDLSRLEGADSRDEVTDVKQAVERALTSHRAAAARKGLSLESDLGAVRDEDVFVKLGDTDLTIALDNLLDNAIAYTDSGSVTVGVTAAVGTAAISVVDTGVGISAEHRDRVFERFYRVDRGRSREQGGTGLGLALVRHVATRHGGTVAVHSEPGSGSTFTLTLPRAL